MLCGAWESPHDAERSIGAPSSALPATAAPPLLPPAAVCSASAPRLRARPCPARPGMQTPSFSFGSAPAFGATATPSLPKATSTPLFGAASTPAFGAASTPGAAHVVGWQAQAWCEWVCHMHSACVAVELRSSPPPAGLFGAASSAAASPFSFGGAASAAASQPSLFGAGPASTPSLFGAAPASTPSLFGAASTPAAGGFGFGAASAPAAGSLFGAQQPAAQQAVAPLAFAGAAPAAPDLSAIRELESIKDSYVAGSTNQRYRFQHLLLNVVDNPAARVKPAGVDELQWREALQRAGGADNPDHLWPVLAHGFKDLLAR